MIDLVKEWIDPNAQPLDGHEIDALGEPMRSRVLATVRDRYKCSAKPVHEQQHQYNLHMREQNAHE